MSGIGISFGAVSDPIWLQLRNQGAVIPDPDDRSRLQGHADAITRLTLHGILTDAEARRARRKLMSAIQEAAVLVRCECAWEREA